MMPHSGLIAIRPRIVMRKTDRSPYTNQLIAAARKYADLNVEAGNRAASLSCLKDWPVPVTPRYHADAPL